MKFSMESELAEFDAFTKEAAKELRGEERSKFIRGLALEYIQIVVPMTPVRTGRARSAWTTGLRRLGGENTVRVSEGATEFDWAEAEAGRREGKYSETGVRGKVGANGLKEAKIYNGVKYIGQLELGSSVQARAGFARLAMRQLQQRWGDNGRKYVERAIKLANLKARMAAKAKKAAGQ